MEAQWRVVLERSMDFLEWIGEDASTRVFMALDDPDDLLRASSVSKSWYHFVITNGFIKKLSNRIFPEVSIFPHIREESNSIKATDGGSSHDAKWVMLKREHKLYSYLIRHIGSPMKTEDCILKPISASSTDNYPDERIEHTLDPMDRRATGPSYWSSKGETDPSIPEKITYRLKSNSCVVSEIKIQPFKAFFQLDHPIYSAKAVRIRLGYSTIDEDLNGQEFTDDYYIWTYVSSEYLMKKENTLQCFKLPRPVVCIGGIVQIELLGRTQRQELGGLFYISICHVKVIGHNLFPIFVCDILHENEVRPVLKHFPDAMDDATYDFDEFQAPKMTNWEAFTKRLGELKSYLSPFKRMLLVFGKSY